MVLFNHSTRELTAKIVYYGPGLCGKTTNLRVLHERLEKGTAGRLLSLATAQDRTIYFDLLPVELGNIKGYTVRFQLCTVPGQVFYNETRKLVLRGVDGVVFVVDSQWSMLSHNLESWQNLVENLRDLSVGIESVPVVIQYNKRDLTGVLSVDALQESLGFPSYPFVEAVASSGQGVVETFKLVSKLTFVDLLRRLQRAGGIESDVFAVASAPPGATADPADETFARSGPPPKRTSFHGPDAEPADPVGTAVAAPGDDPLPAAPAREEKREEKEQPFDAEPGWLPPAEMDVFALGTSEAAPPPPAAAPAPALVAAALAPVAAPSPELRAAVDRHEAALAELRASVEAQRAELEGQRRASETHREGLEAQRGALETARAELARLLEEARAALVPRAEHDALSKALGEVRALAEAVREELRAARTELGTSVEGLASSTGERVASLGSDLFSLREEGQKARAALADAQRALAERMEAVSAAHEAPDPEIERLAGVLRTAEEARRALVARLESAEQEISRTRAVTEETHRLLEERLGTAERRTKSLAESIRRAIESLGD